jgi:hypothetical protein
MNKLEQARLEQWRLNEQRRIDQRRLDDLKAADQRAADDRARAELRHRDAMRLADMRTSSDPATREIGEKVQRVMDSRDRQEVRERDLSGRGAPTRGLHGSELPDPHMDPGWLARWERDGVVAPLTPAEREKLREIDRQDPMGREQREQFLPREVLGIRANSDRQVAAFREKRDIAGRMAGAAQVQEERPHTGVVQAPEPTKSDKAPAAQHTQDQDEDEELEM